MANFSQSVTDFLTEIEIQRDNLRKICSEKLKEVFTLFWEQNPGVNSIVWTQYAPYFNDGDPCEFRVHDPTFSNAIEEDDIMEVNYDYEGEKEGVWAAQVWDFPEDIVGVSEEDAKALSNLICSRDMEDAMELMFGPDSRVVATRDGFSSDTYEGSHD